jgi:hypothetical protein
MLVGISIVTAENHYIYLLLFSTGVLSMNSELIIFRPFL